MKKKAFFIVTLLCSLTSSFAQECRTTFTGTPSIYPLNNKSIKAKGSSSAICINVFFHIVRNTNGTNAFTLPDTDVIVADLNLSYSPHNIVINNLGTNFINNTSFVNVSKGEHTTLMNSGYDVSNAINYYIVEELWDVFDHTGTYRGFVAGVADNIPSNSLVIRSDRVF